MIHRTICHQRNRMCGFRFGVPQITRHGKEYMWTRKELKKQARHVMKYAYWRCVLAAFVLLVIGVLSDEAGSALRKLPAVGGLFEYRSDGPSAEFYAGSLPQLHFRADGFSSFFSLFTPYLPILLIAAAAIVLIGLVLKFAVSVFLCNPLEAGAKRIFVINHYTEGKAGVGEMMHPFSHGYLNVVKTLFLRDLFLVLWTLLFIVPGIVKSYSYRMVPYILAEDPEMNWREAFRLSRKMMDGQKWNAFVLDLSFILWEIFSICTLGILKIFYVAPYEQCTNAALYVALKSHLLGQPAPGQTQQGAQTQQGTQNSSAAGQQAQASDSSANAQDRQESSAQPASDSSVNAQDGQESSAQPASDSSVNAQDGQESSAQANIETASESQAAQGQYGTYPGASDSNAD